MYILSHLAAPGLGGGGGMVPTHGGVPEPLSQVGMLDAALLASRFNNKLDRFVSRYRDPLVQALVAPWDHYTLIYAFYLLKPLSGQI